MPVANLEKTIPRKFSIKVYSEKNFFRVDFFFYQSCLSTHFAFLKYFLSVACNYNMKGGRRKLWKGKIKDVGVLCVCKSPEVGWGSGFHSDRISQNCGLGPMLSQQP